MCTCGALEREPVVSHGLAPHLLVRPPAGDFAEVVLQGEDDGGGLFDAHQDNMYTRHDNGLRSLPRTDEGNNDGLWGHTDLGKAVAASCDHCGAARLSLRKAIKLHHWQMIGQQRGFFVGLGMGLGSS